MTLGDPPPYSAPSHGSPSLSNEKSPYATSEPSHLLAHHICGISLADTDKIRLINTPEPLTHLVRAAIAATWGPIQSECAEFDSALGRVSNTSHDSSSSSSSYSSCTTPIATTPFYSYEFKLKGNPWAGWGEEKVRCRRLVVGLLKCMIGQGYSLIQTSKVIRRMGERDTFFFESSSLSSSSSSADKATKETDEKEEEREEEDDVDMFSITFNKNNTVRVIDASPAAAVYIQQAIQRYWPPTGIKSQELYWGADEFLINPVGWTEALVSYSGEAVRWSMVLVEILSALRNHLGYKLYTSVDMNLSPGTGMAIDTWILRKVDPSWS